MEIEYTGPYEPVRSSDGAAGFDLITIEGASIYPGTSHKFKTGLHLVIPAGYVGIVKSRSGLSFNKSVEVGAGVIDSDYRGEVRVNLYNHGTDRVVIQTGDRIAQLLIQKCEEPEFVCCGDLDAFNYHHNNSKRGESGFGSTGR
jgi:dUTP pyrophosphatase